MDVGFADPRLRERCSKEKDLRRHYGDRQAKKIMRRLQHLRVAQTLQELSTMPGRMHPLTADRAGTFAVDLVHPYRLVFEVNVPEGHDLWLSCDAKIKITEIVDYHEQ